MQVFVKTLSGKTVILEVKSSETTRRLHPINMQNNCMLFLPLGKGGGKLCCKREGKQGWWGCKGYRCSEFSPRSSDLDCWNPDITPDHSWAALWSIVKTTKGYVTTQHSLYSYCTL